MGRIFLVHSSTPWLWRYQRLAAVCLSALVLTAARPSAAEAPPPSKPASPSASSEERVYAGGLGPGWQDWGWGRHDLTGPTARIDFSGYGGWILHHEPRSARYGSVSFRISAPASFGDFLELRLANGDDNSAFPAVPVGHELTSPAPGGWLDVTVPWALLNPSGGTFDRITLHAAKQVPATWVQLDALRLTRFDPALAVAPSAPPRSARAAGCRSVSTISAASNT